MEPVQQLFLDAYRASLHGESVSWQEPLPPETWAALFRLAGEHHVLPMICQSVYACPAASSADLQPYRQQLRRQVAVQTVKTSAFLPLLAALQAAGVTPLVVKGIVCRSLYPEPELRTSSDEDILIPPEQYPLADPVLRSFGLAPTGSEDASDCEHPYRQQDGPLYIELHCALFPPESPVYGDWNRLFEGVFDRAEPVTVSGTAIPTLSPDDHLLYLILHAFKHFLHSGFGIRQVSDICMFASACASLVDWPRLYENCRAVRAGDFASAVFRIGEEYLGIALPALPETFRSPDLDALPLLEDLLSSGVYGSSSLTRQHSSNVTLNAVAAEKNGKQSSLLQTVFPSASQLSGRYPYLKKNPWLLPVAWGQRIFHYQKETSASGSSAVESARIGQERTELLRRYHVID